jgi:SAM-dependent methyltransferase
VEGGARRIWAAGDYARTAQRLDPAAHELVAALGDVAGARVLDVGAGTGNAAIAAAAAGATAVGIDPTPELLAVARERTARDPALASRCSWVVGDAVALPFPDEDFDAVVSAFGVMFAADHERAAAELVRVCRPGGRIALASWLPEGALAEFGGLVAGAMPQPAAPAGPSPAAWGNQETVRSLLEPHGVELRFERRLLPFTAPSPAAYLDEQEEVHGMLALAREALDEPGRRALRLRLLDALERGNEASDGSLLVTSAWLLAVGERTR